MNISSEGVRLIKNFEGYHTRLPNGDCAAYLCPARVATIGYGCTEGVKLGMVWTHEQAESALMRELAKFEAGVTRLVTVDLNQNQYDALVSFAYNVGLGALGRSTLLKFVNAKKWEKAANEFKRWNRGGGRVLPGLVSRRAREAALFLKPVEAPEAPAMPQQVAESVPWWRRLAVRMGLAGGGSTIAAAEVGALPPPPDISAALSWRSFGDTAAGLVQWCWANPIIPAALAVWVLVLVYLPRMGTPWAQSSD